MPLAHVQIEMNRSKTGRPSGRCVVLNCGPVPRMEPALLFSVCHSCQVLARREERLIFLADALLDFGMKWRRIRSTPVCAVRAGARSPAHLLQAPEGCGACAPRPRSVATTSMTRYFWVCVSCGENVSQDALANCHARRRAPRTSQAHLSHCSDEVAQYASMFLRAAPSSG